MQTQIYGIHAHTRTRLLLCSSSFLWLFAIAHSFVPTVAECRDVDHVCACAQRHKSEFFASRARALLDLHIIHVCDVATNTIRLSHTLNPTCKHARTQPLTALVFIKHNDEQQSFSSLR